MAIESLFTITVDTEADDAWRNQDFIGMKNMSVLPRFQALCSQYGIVPTYLLTYECATREEALKVLKPYSDQRRCEIGYHFHAWTTPPFEKPSPEGVDLKWRYAYQYELPDSLFREKAECLLKAIESAYGVRATAHRAGRWGIDQRTVKWLVEHRFLVDTSIVPLVNFSGCRGATTIGPNFFSSPSRPFFLHLSSGDNKDQSLMEIPLTIYRPQHILPALLVEYLKKYSYGAKYASRLYQKLIGGTGVLRPDPNYLDGWMQKIIRSNLKHGPTIINMMIHSTELMFDQSPFSRTVAACERLWDNLKQAFELVQKTGIKSMGISACADEYREHILNYASPVMMSRTSRANSLLLP